MSASEQTAWYGEAAKGAYNYTDLNRVETAVAELAGMIGLTLTIKNDWTQWDIPVQADMERYLNNVVAIRDACPGHVEFPNLPDSMSGLTFEGANNIEKVLLLAYEVVSHDCTLGEFVLGECTLGGTIPQGTDSTIRSGEIYCGEVV